MKVGVIVDGDTEFHVIPILLTSTNEAPRVKVLYADIQPHATPARIARAAKTALDYFLRNGYQSVILTIDLEDLDVHPGDRAKQIEQALIAQYGTVVSVAVKVRCIENWLVADPHSINTFLRNTYTVSEANIRKVIPNKADNLKDALRVLKASKLGNKDSYDKVSDGVRIAKVLDPWVVAENSRSFRRFLRLVGCTTYAAQSQRPVAVKTQDQARRSTAAGKQSGS